MATYSYAWQQLSTAALLLIAVFPLLTVQMPTGLVLSTDTGHTYRVSSKVLAAAQLGAAHGDRILQQLDAALTKISTVYMQALFAGTHSIALESRMRALEMELFDLLDALYKQNRMAEYMKYEAEVTRQMILYNMLKKLFGYAAEENERIKE